MKLTGPYLEPTREKDEDKTADYVTVQNAKEILAGASRERTMLKVTAS